MPKKIIVASKNPVKKEMTKRAFEKMFPTEKFEFEGVSVESGVKDQPTSNTETLTGAENRTKNAMEYFQNADYWVGIEGGIEKVNGEMESFAWVSIKSKYMSGKAKTGTYYLPKKIVELINEGKELGEADDIVFKYNNSKQKNGSTGILTKNIITRTIYGEHAIILALIPFVNQDIY